MHVGKRLVEKLEALVRLEGPGVEENEGVVEFELDAQSFGVGPSDVSTGLG